MAGSLRDQLLNAGVVDKKQARKAGHDVKRARKKGGKPAASVAEKDLADAQRSKAEHDRELNRAKIEAQRARETEAQVRQLIERHRLARDEGETPFNFQDGNSVRTVRVTDEQRAGLVSGRFAIVGIGEEYDVVPDTIAGRIEERSPAHVLAWNKTEADVDGADDDDPYRDFVVPDDLTW